jgi:acyl carrier protein
MDKNLFLQNFVNIFDDTELSALSVSTNFRDIEEWTSLTALSLLAMVEEEYAVCLNDADLKKCLTIDDIILVIESKTFKNGAN